MGCEALDLVPLPVPVLLEDGADGGGGGGASRVVEGAALMTQT